MSYTLSKMHFNNYKVNIMKKKILIIIVVFVVFVSILVCFLPNIDIAVLKHRYKQDQSTDNLYKLCSLIYTEDSYSDIIEYFPLLIKDEKFDDVVAGDVNNKLSVTDIKNIFVDAYVYACYTNLSFMEFSESFSEIFPYFIYEKDGDSDYTIYLQTHFLDTFTTNKELTKAYCDVLKDIYKDERLSLDLRKDGYEFISYWYGDIGDMDSYYEVKKSFNKIAEEDEITITDEQIDQILEHRKQQSNKNQS